MFALPKKALALLAAMVAVAALFGASLGIVAAGQKPTLFEGSNPTYGGPLAGDVTPDHWVSCLPSQSWRAVYMWEPNSQTWRHYFNTEKNIPAYVNNAEVGGIVEIPRLRGLAMIMDQQVDSPFMPDAQTQQCP